MKVDKSARAVLGQLGPVRLLHFAAARDARTGTISYMAADTTDWPVDQTANLRSRFRWRGGSPNCLCLNHVSVAACSGTLTGRSAPCLAHNRHRARGVVDAVARYRPQVHAWKFTTPVAADNEQFRILGCLGERDCGTALD